MDSKTPYIIGGLAVVGIGAYFLLRKPATAAAATTKPGTPALPASVPAKTVPATAPPGWPQGLAWPPAGLPTGTALPTTKPAGWPANIPYPPAVPSLPTTLPTTLPTGIPGVTPASNVPSSAQFNRLGATPDQEMASKVGLWQTLQMVALQDPTANPAVLDPAHTVGPGSPDPTGISASTTIAQANDAQAPNGGQYVLIASDPTSTTFAFVNAEGALQQAGVGQPWTLFLMPNEWRTVQANALASGGPQLPQLPTPSVPGAPTIPGVPAGMPAIPAGMTDPAAIQSYLLSQGVSPAVIQSYLLSQGYALPSA